MAILKKDFPTLAELRRDTYEYHNSSNMLNVHGIDPNDWRRNPYTFCKSRYYMELSCLLVCALLRTRVTANFVTLMYVFFGLLGGLLIGVKNETAVYIGIGLVFNKGILDWTDGLLARQRRQTSLKGHLLDDYGTKVGSIALITGLAFYLQNKLASELVLYALVMYLMMQALKVTVVASESILQELKEGKIRLENSHDEEKSESLMSGLGCHKQVLRAFVKPLLMSKYIFDDRARGVDTLLLVVFIEMQFPDQVFSLYIFYFMILRASLAVIYDFIKFYYGTWLQAFTKT